MHTLKHTQYLNCFFFKARYASQLFLRIGCSHGYFGMSCKEQCSEHCINNDPCDHVSGICPNGCQDGYNGSHCNKCKKWTNSCLGSIFKL